MDSLKTIQKTFRIFLRLTHAAKILCIVGTVLSGAGAFGCLMAALNFRNFKNDGG